MRPHHRFRMASLMILLSLALGAVALPLPAQVALANHTPAPASVNLVGDLQSEATAGACGDWDPGCAGSAFGAQGQGVYLFESASIPAGSWQYKVALGSWDENYGGTGQPNGANIDISLPAARTVRFYYDHDTHYIADNVRTTIYTVPGSFNSELGCGDWAPECLATFMSDVDGDGVFAFATDDIPPGSYEFKVATNESWSNPNYGDGGGPGNVPFTVTSASRVAFSFNTASNTPGVTVTPLSSVPAHDNNVEWDGLRHDSRDLRYRTPGGAVPAGTPVRIRLRTYHDDVTAVRLRLYDVSLNAQRFVPMAPAAEDVPCGADVQRDVTCDFWQATLNEPQPNNLWYRFIVSDGSDTNYYADSSAALDGGLGATSDDQLDYSYALMFYDPSFVAPSWARGAVIYQIFPDRFRNGRKDNDPKTGDVRYDDPVIKLPWGTLPEGYCRNYADGNTNCPWRFDSTPPDPVNKENPRGRDYFGGDLKGVDQQLDYLQRLGVTAMYFNPLFDAGSNHSYDTQDYYRIDPYFGTQKDWESLDKHANQRGMRIILDSVFNHMSSDSAFFDRYQHYATVGACESAGSPYRPWFVFRAPAGQEPSPCAPSAPGGSDTYYAGWFGFDSIPEIRKTEPAVQQYFVTGPNSVSRYWLRQGAEGWRLDVMGDASFPADYWTKFRTVVKQQSRGDALIIGELWQKDSTLLRHLRGQTADATMNYRMRDAVIGLLIPPGQLFDSKGFAESGRQIAPSEFMARMESIREDYPDAAYYSLMNLLGSHDTERILWTLTPGSETRAEREFNAANLAAGKQRLRLASLIQFAVPGSPTVYYGDEVGVTGDDDPDDRRTYPWADLGGNPDTSLMRHYQALAALRKLNGALVNGDFRGLLADDAAGTMAFGRRTAHQGAVVAINRSDAQQTLAIPVGGYLPDGTRLWSIYGVGTAPGARTTVSGGVLNITLPPLSGALLVTGPTDLKPTAAPAGLSVTAEGSDSIGLAWNAVSGAAGYNVYRSVLSGGGFERVNAAPVTGTSYTDTGLANGRTYYYVVQALDAAGNESAPSNEVIALPHYQIGWANLQWPPTLSHTVSAVSRTDTVYGQVWIDGVTNQPGATPNLLAQLGFGPDGSSPDGNPAWIWVDAGFNANAGNNDEFQASLQPEAPGVYDYAYRYSTTGGREWVYADLDGIGNGYSPAQAGSLTVSPSSDTTAPPAPAGLTVITASPAGISLAWDAVSDNAALFGYEVRRSATSGGPYTTVATVTDPSYVDTAVDQGATYFYVVRALDASFNRSADSAEVQATAALRTVTLTFTLTVPATTDATGQGVYIAGFLDRLDGGLPQWNPGGVVLTRVDATTWRITLTGKEGTQIEYKYALGSWDFVEKDGACGEVANRLLTLSYGATGAQAVNDSVANWRNVAPCGN